MNDYSRASLIQFLDYLAEKGMVKQATVSARKAASSAILGILDEQEAADLRSLNVDEIVVRFSNLQGAKFTPGSLQTYKSRFNSALDDFFRYREDPLNFKPALSARAARSKSKQTKDEKGASDVSASKGSYTGNSGGYAVSRNDHAGVVFPIPLRANVVVQIAGISKRHEPVRSK